MSGKGMTPRKGYNHALYAANYDRIFKPMNTPTPLLGHAGFTAYPDRPVRLTPRGRIRVIRDQDETKAPAGTRKKRQRRGPAVGKRSLLVKAAPVPVRKDQQIGGMDS